MMPGQQPGMMTPTPAAQPTANLGAQSLAAEKVKQALIVLETALPEIPLDSELHSAVRTSINALAKQLPKSSEGGAGLQQSMMRDLALRQQQMAPLIQAMQARGAASGGPPQAGPAAPPQGE